MEHESNQKEYISIEDELRDYKRMCEDLKLKVTHLEEDHKVICDREREAQERKAELVIENMELECGLRRAEEEIEVWKKRFRELESRVLCLEEEILFRRGGEPELVSKVGEEPEDIPEVVSVKEDKGNPETSQVSKIENGRTSSASLTPLQSHEKMFNCDEKIHAFSDAMPGSRSPVEQSGDLQVSGQPPINKAYKPLESCIEQKISITSETKVKYGSQIRKQLVFEQVENPNKNVVSSMVGNAIPASEDIINISDSDDEVDINPTLTSNIWAKGTTCVSTECALSNEVEMTVQKCLKGTHSGHIAEENEISSKENFPSTSTPKRKLASKVIISDSEGDYDDMDDKIPISKLKMKKLQDFEKLKMKKLQDFEGKTCVSTECSLSNEMDMTVQNCLKGTHSGHIGEKNNVSSEENIPSTSTPKRKRASKVITSDSEDDNDDVDDQILISKLKTKKLEDLVHKSSGSPMNCCSVAATVSFGLDNVDQPITPSRRRLLSLRECEERKDRADRTSPSHCEKSGTSLENLENPSTENAKENEMEGVVSDSEGESLGGFIVSESEDMDSEDSYIDSEDVADNDLPFDQILSRIRRKRDNKLKWEYEADMLSSFENDPELCLKAVCALYRQQTTDEQSMKGSLYFNKRGFNKFDAFRGTILAEFLIDGDPQGELKKSVKELQKYDPNALDQCTRLAKNYSKQLFEIYKNKEDPLFLPS